MRRPINAPLMPRMLELPPLPIEAVEGREPVLRLRHSITNTNYYVQIFAESAPGVAPAPLAIAGEEESEILALNPGLDAAALQFDPEQNTEAPFEVGPLAAGVVPDHVRDLVSLAARPSVAARAQRNYGDEPFIAAANDIPGLDVDARLTAPEGALLSQVPTAESDLEWTPANRLLFLPLTGLTRKVLQRLGVMTLPRVHLA
jgi:A/G-specific adenine glycosylase